MTKFRHATNDREGQLVPTYSRVVLVHGMTSRFGQIDEFEPFFFSKKFCFMPFRSISVIFFP
jgi:hypothetical protein